MSMSRFDALIIGGGPAGSTTALLLARAGWSVALVERKTFPRRKVCGEYLSATNWPLLHELGIADQCRSLAGPAIRRVGLYTGENIFVADLPRRNEGANGWGISISRAELDTLLVRWARQAGVTLFQPATALALRSESDGISCEVFYEHTQNEIQANVGILAHGSWETSSLPTQNRQPWKGSELLGFKANFVNSSLPDDLMPLLTFRGGYGGMVMGTNNHLSISCCIRRDVLHKLREHAPGKEAGEVLQDYLLLSCRGVREALSGGRRIAPWMAAGPIRPGIRPLVKNRIFRVGNAAGEAHPVVAEGISMAIQGAWALADQLIQHRNNYGINNWQLCEVAYKHRWRSCFASRIRTAALLATWAQSPLLVKLSLPLLHLWPQVLTWGAALSGKTKTIISLHRGELAPTPT